MVLPLLLVVVAAAPASPDAFRSGWAKLRADEARLTEMLDHGGTDLDLLGEEGRRVFLREVTSFVERLERLKPPPELARCHRYAIAAGKSVPPLVMSLPPPPPTDPATGRIILRSKPRPIEETEAARERSNALLRPFEAIAAGRRVCGIADLPPEPWSRGEVDTWFSYARPPWLAELEPAEPQYLEAWSGLLDAESMTASLLRNAEPGGQEFRGGLDEYWNIIAEVASTVARQRPAPAFATCHRQALEAAERLQQALRALSATVEPAKAGDKDRFWAACQVVAHQLHALDDARMVCGIYFPGAK
jgi:hypothetical protein